ncbi:hypothetical protein ACR63F_005793 [Pseudomonas aeruginosa]|uniref:hypothetical protein n=1 Tax=Pseudomonas aeruginosa TaxID=287 RepID=UPI000E30CB5F|nr:hypothetical protein [Pseudomonas aeruginosa]NPY92870.1 hypothetical protein [Pseudomonas aeruginosa]
MNGYSVKVNPKTGTFHLSIGINNPLCNQRGSKRIPRLAQPSDAQFKAAPAAKFCARCFPNGKPDSI